MSSDRKWNAADARAALRNVPILAEIDDEQLDQLAAPLTASTSRPTNCSRLMSADQDGQVICVDLRRTFVPSKGFGVLPAIVQPPGLVRRLVTGTDMALPPLRETLLRTVDLAASNVNLRELPRIAAIIEPDISAIGPLDFKKLEAALEVGRKATRAVLDAQPNLARA
ncbi:hypothetical protein IQ46_10825 [Mycobacterium rhizamassiliense]|jgi:NTE family protein|uniref:Uncharacterized protein n=1 Tax=Mycobacterium rhizamassiliense TaxID=1841860 RepID=A0A2U3NZE7_9MYCO|nr:hypothetical protein IQ46_10825 [Mycobacterium rhizamassiliense]